MPTTISVDEEIADELYSRKARGESYNDVLKRLLRKADAYDEGGDLSDTDSYDTENTHQRGEPQPPEAGGREEVGLDELVGRVGEEVLPGSGAKLEERKEALQATVRFLQDHGTATPQDFKQNVYPDHKAGYTEGKNPPRSWWKNCIYKGMAELAQRSDEILSADTNGEWSYAGGKA